MVKDLVGRDELEGATREDVVHLLGPPDHSSKSTLSYEVGYMGFNRNALMVFSYRLLFELGADGTVKKVRVHD